MKVKATTGKVSKGIQRRGREEKGWEGGEREPKHTAATVPYPFPDITWLTRLARQWLLFTTSSSLPPFKNPQVP